MINISKIHHRDQDRIKLDFKYDKDIIAKLKTIDGAAWSKTHNAWHIPYSPMSLQALKNLFPTQLIYPKKEGPSVEETTPQKTINNSNSEATPQKIINNSYSQIRIEVIGRKIILKMPRNEADIKFILSIRYSRWDKSAKCWIIPNFPGNIDLLNDHFRGRINALILHDEFEINTGSDVRKIANDEVLIIKTSKKRLKILFTFNKPLTNFIRQFPYHSWDNKHKWWTIPYSEHYIDEIREFVENISMKLLIEFEPEEEGGVARMSINDIPNYRRCPQEMKLKLLELRYSETTIRTYCGLFEEFINYHHSLEIEAIDETQIIKYLRYLVIERKISTSYQNQAINAIKFYYERVLGGERKFYFIDRPRKEKALPTVLSTEEIVQLFRCIDNLKHKCMLMLAYSSGLRLGEVVRLKLIDIDRERMQIRIVQGKGRKDRYAKLSEKYLLIFDEYLEKYNPKEFAFEGATGADYSPSSIQNIIKDAVRRAGIKKHTTMHTLRHTYATHSLENGIDIRYIQAMLGHDKAQTTQIYTHVTTKGMKNIKSPLDSLEI